ncbi:hypothetical protein MIND_01187400 [Mycena indigotica]|uniref:Uncharacterized protein n=1 Tax=Mycena indigotica TaxID=2126181 RepID=A0A8H6S5U1_9AGAR|nr:uncharacterized protein MIND_01187400 [Mycena indigotica]KAF7292883.1 hypothetical protein MIND_01187400 [Mycena indigotica]
MSSRFASLINYRPNLPNLNKKKAGGSSGSKPFSLRRADPTSSLPYEVFDISTGKTSFSESERSFEATLSSSLPTTTTLPSSLPTSSLSAADIISPRVDVDIEFTPTDWFPSHFLKTDSIAGPSSLGITAPKVIVESRTGASGDEEEFEDEDDDDDAYSTISEDVGEDLRALGASDFLRLPETDGLLPPATPPRKGAPSPIKIPNASLHGPRIQIERTTSMQSRPDSVFSMLDTAVSGTTIARALIGDSFVLSHDRSSRYRSGGSVLTRSDSATLPRGEHPFSPAWTIRRSSTADGGEGDLPPLPPMPEMPDELRKVIAESRKTKGSPTTSPGAESSYSDERRISRITEVLTPTSDEVVSPQSGPPPDSALALSDTSSPPLSPPLAHPGAASPSAFPTSPGQMSNLSGSDHRSSRDIDNVLDYYNFDASPGNTSSFDPLTPDPRADPNRFQPAFSPITEVTEDSNSQMSPNSFRSRMNTNATPSPALSPSPAKQEWRSNEIRSLPPHPGLLVTHDDKPRTTPPPIIIPPPPMAASGSSRSLPTLIRDEEPPESSQSLHPPSKGLFNRLRAGSAPSPIEVVRDSQDITSYNITVTPRVETASSSSTPITGNEEGRQQQTFPETPSAFSPTFSTTSDATSAGERNSMLPPAMPVTAGAKTGFASLAQQVLLTRSSTTGGPVFRPGGGRPSHTREGSVGVVGGRAKANRTTVILPSAAAATILKEILPSSPEEPEPVPALPEENGNDKEDASFSHAPDTESVYSIGSYSTPADPQQQKRQSQSSDAHSSSLHDHPKRDYQAKPLPAMPMSPVSSAESDGMVEASAPAPVLVTAISASGSSTSLSQPPSSGSGSSSAEALPLSLSRKSTPAVVDVVLPPPTIEETPAPPIEQTIEVPPEFQRPPVILTPPPPPVDPLMGSPHIVPLITPARANGEASPMHASLALGSPPPYYTVIYDRDTTGQERMTPSTGGSNGYPEAYTPFTPAMNIREQRTSISSLNPPNTARSARHQRPRPPLPVGPRRPSMGVATPGPSGGRNRNGSVSSIASNVHGRRTTSSAPRFQTPPVKWRGYTMEAAKWTFSSAQLQSIVSRAIRQSAEASSIRLLRLETIDTDIPEELHQLEMQRTDVKTRYKMLSRRRANLLSTLTGNLDGTEPEDPTYSLRLVENLKEVSTELDRLAEDLHSADEQIAQLTSLRDIHSASALAMALRKLNASFLKQISANEELKQQVTTLQAERDEAWSQAVDVAHDYDDLNERLEMQSPGSSSYSHNHTNSINNKRSSRVMASKISSIRVSRAGLRPSSRRSSVSSIGAQRYSSALPSAATDDIPPVPPIPRRRPDDIRTDLSLRTSALSTSPSSETRALDLAQAELYNMLGIPFPGGSRRSHSVILSAASDSESAHNPLLSPPLQSRAQRKSDASRPSSLPGNSKLSEALNAITADRTAILATLGMLDD